MDDSTLEITNNRLAVRVEEYKAVLDYTAKLSDRRQIINDIFVGINSLFLTTLGFLFINSHLTDWEATYAFGIVTVFTTIVNIIWLMLVGRYKNLLNVRYQYLRALEGQIGEMVGLTPLNIKLGLSKHEPTLSVPFGIHVLENMTDYKDAPKVSFADIERSLVIFFIGTYFVVTGIVAALTALASQGVIAAPKF